MSAHLLSLGTVFVFGAGARELVSRLKGYFFDYSRQDEDHFLDQLEILQNEVSQLRADGEAIPSDMDDLLRQMNRLLAVLTWRYSARAFSLTQKTPAEGPQESA